MYIFKSGAFIEILKPEKKKQTKHWNAQAL